MDWRELIVDGYDRLPDLMMEVLAGVGATDVWQPARDCNTLGWTAWHLTRVQDSQIADLAGGEQLWIAEGWHRKFDRPADPEDTGYNGDTAARVRAFRSPSGKVQLDYLRATVARTQAYLAALEPADLDRELDEPYRPRPTVAVRYLSILADCHQHAGEASYIRGLLRARGRRPRPSPAARGKARRAPRTRR